MPNNGHSPLRRADGIERATNLDRVYLKREDCLPSGFHKFRAARAICSFAKARGIRQVVAASCGGYAAALLYAAQGTRLDLHLFLPPTSDTAIPLLSLACLVVRSANYEAAVEEAAVFAQEKGFLDVTPGGVMSGVLRLALGSAAIEIAHELGAIPGAIFCPVGNGTTLAGMFERLIVAEPTTFPAFYGVGITENVLFRSCGRSRLDTKYGWLEPLRGEMPSDAMGVTAAIRLSGGEFVAVQPEQIEEAQVLLRNTEGIEVALPAAAAVAGMIETFRRHKPLAATDVVCVITAAG